MDLRTAGVVIQILKLMAASDGSIAAEEEELLESVLEELEAAASPAIFFFLPVLKSVSYHPLPFRRNPAADIFFFSSDLLQAGQSVKGSSLSFCNTSNSWLHDWH